MSLMNLLAGAGGGDGLGALAEALGVDAGTVEALAGQIAPAIAGGVKRRAASEGGMGAVLGALKGEDAAAWYDDPRAAARPDAQAQGEAFLSRMLGDEDAAPRLAQAAAERAGAPADLAAKMLPALAAMALGALQRNAPDQEIDAAMSGLAATGDRAGAGIGDLLGALSGGGGGLGGLIGAATSGGGLSGMLSGLGGGAPAAGSGGGLGALLQMLDRDGDGNPLDDVLGMVMK